MQRRRQLRMTENFEQLTKKVVRRFLQTAVIVDDLPSTEPPSKPAGDLNGLNEPPGHHVPGMLGTQTAAELEMEEADDTGERNALDERGLIDAFADLGIACAVLKPVADDDQTFHRRYREVVTRADIVLLDWILFPEDRGDCGKKSLALLDELFSGDRVRLVAVYSGAPDTDRLREAIMRSAKERNGGRDTPFDSRGGVTVGFLRICVIGKTAKAGPNYVSEADLPERLVEEFALLANGLLQTVALAALAAVRANSQRILAQFPSRLDAAFVAEWVAQHKADEVERQWLPLVLDEVHAEIEDDAMVVETTAAQTPAIWAGRQPVAFDGRSGLAELLTNGLCESAGGRLRTGKDVTRLDVENLVAHLQQSQQDLAGSTAPGHLLAEVGLKFQNRRSPSGAKRRIMRPGTVVTVGWGSRRWLVCVQPVCDCLLRGADEKRAFLFLPIERWRNRGGGSGDAGDGFLILAGRQDPAPGCPPEEMVVRTSVRQLKLFTLKRSAGTPFVMSSDTGDFGASETGNLGGGTQPETILRWAMELKPTVAQAITERLSSNLSRVGIPQSEWLRLAGRTRAPQQ